MKFTITIECDNAAFTDDAAHEVARILREAADKLERGQTEFKLMDYNGNTVGRAKVEA